MKYCSNCVLPETFPGISFNEDGVCNICLNYKKKEGSIYNDFKDKEELKNQLQIFYDKKNKYDVLIPVSGGTDSSYTLIELVKNTKLRPLCIHNDHGYEDQTGTENVKGLCKALDVDLIIKQQDLGFMKKLWKYVYETPDTKGVNGCFFCANILYFNFIEVAMGYNIPLIVNGNSKGQAQMTNDSMMGINTFRTMQSIFRRTNDKEFEEKYLEKYDKIKYVINYQDKGSFLKAIDEKKILVIPFYVFKFNKTNKSELRKEIKKVFNWKSSINSYPKRTTNCQMNWLSTLVDQKKLGFTVFEKEYSEIVRAGDFTRKQALQDLMFNPPVKLIKNLINEIHLDISHCGINQEDLQ